MTNRRSTRFYEFKPAINDYLATLDPAQVPSRTLADLIAFNQRHADEELIVFGQEIFDWQLAKGGGPAALIDPVWGDVRAGGRSPIAGAAAIAGYPSITVPAGLVSGLPVGITLVTRRNQDGLLPQTARAYERAAGARVVPHISVGAPIG